MEEGKIILQSEATPNQCMKNDLPLLTDEKFDFDLSLSPTSENEDEVFVGPISHKEKCIAVSLDSPKEPEDKLTPSRADTVTWSPLAGEKFVEIFKEAHLVALQLQSGSKIKKNAGYLEEKKTENVEKFVQESRSKLKMLEKGLEINKTPKEIKRETYCVSESSVCQLPPLLQKHSKHPFSAMGNCPSPQTPQNTSSPGVVNKRPQMPATPSAQGKGDKKANVFQTGRKSTAFGNNNCLAAGQLRQGKLHSSSSRNYLNSMGSSEDLLSDRSSIASDAGDVTSCSNSLVQDKRNLPTPSKLGINMRPLKPNVHMRRNTSSSSSSLSSMNSSLNSSLSISPKRGNGVASKAPAKGSRLSSSTSKSSVVRPMKALSTVSHSEASGKHQRSTGAATKGSPPVSSPKHKGTRTSETSGSGIPREGSDQNLQKLLRKSITGSTRSYSSPMLKSKTVPPVLKEDKLSGNVAARVLQPFEFGSNVALTPRVKQSEDCTVSNSIFTAKAALRTPACNRQSGLPTPVGRRMSGIPTLTPKTVSRLTSSPRPVAPCQVSSVPSKKTAAASSKWVKEKKTQMTSSSSSTEEDSSLQVVPIALNFSPEQPSVEKEPDFSLKEKSAEETASKECLLIDIGINETPVAIQECENKPLIDLFNTPEAKVPVLKTTGLLIDLSSPLIRLSPEGNKENLDSPLLKF
ncbi:G2 and S phase-expressed protein 1 [Varanus komodoensis]|uniref:G2 and S phase-expressed protein 1 n=1 Tax=Varanus komodoensis TaxID=61221 RepID=UPI001CF7E102|nr:G2 and S phase-expressed protein 1 [Varanus komodoensis]